jgi:hypothetical protein
MSDAIKSALIGAGVTITLCAISIIAYVKLVQSNPTGETTFEYSPTDHIVRITAKDGKIDIDELLKRLTSSQTGLAAATTWFRQNKQMYSLTQDSAEMIAAMTNMCPVSNTYTAVTLIDQLNTCIQEHLIIYDLRNRARAHEVPFETVADVITIGIPSKMENQPNKGRANGCGDGKFVRHRVEVYDRTSTRHYTVNVTGHYACSVGLAPDLQLNPSEAGWLFGSANFDRTQKAYALVLYE